MMSTDGKDNFDEAIAAAMRDNLDASGRDCPAADVLAAFVARSLDEGELARCEDHFARCALCQRVLASLARAGTIAPAAGEHPDGELTPAADTASFAAALAADDDEGPHGEDEGLLAAVRRGFRFTLGPFPLSVTLHLLVLLFLIITVHEQRGRELIMVNLEAGGGGGGSSELADLDMPEVPMPDTEPQQMENPQAVDTSQAVGLANDYLRAAGGGGIGIGRGGGMGSGYGHGIGSGFGGFIGELRRKGLDVVLVIDGTGSMNLIIDDVKAKMAQLIQSIHRLVPIARVGIVVYGGDKDPLQVQPLTLSPQKLEDFLSRITAKGGEEWEENMYGATQFAVDKMDWKPYAKKVIVLVGDSPPHKQDFQPLIQLIHKFKDENGTFNTVDVAAEEHERFEREFWLKVHREEPPKISPLPEFMQQTRASFKVLANAGGGSMKSLTKDTHINQQVLILAFGEQWQSAVSAFGRGLEK